MQITTLEKEKRGKAITEGGLERQLKDLLHPLLMKAAGTAVTFKVIPDNKRRLIPGRPVIYAANHYCGQDITIALRCVPERTVVVAGVQPLNPVDELFFRANGVIFVDRMDREDGASSKRAMVANLKAGRNVLIFPEGTSNVSDELLMYPMKWGVISAAREAGAQIVPMILDYDKTAGECHVYFCDPLLVDERNDREGIELLRDTMATERYRYFEQHPAACRRDMDIEAMRKENSELLLSYKLLDYDYERRVVFRPYTTREEVFAPVDALRRGKEGVR